jgi:hypothetical protein
MDIPPIFIPSRGRPDGTTMRLLDSEDIPYVVVIEPHEIDMYRGYGSRCCVLPNSHQGIGYSRNYILDHATTSFWMMDDDLRSFYRKEENHGLRKTVRPFLMSLWNETKNILREESDVAFIGCKNGTFAIPKTPITWNTDIAHIVYVNLPIIRSLKVSYEPSCKVFEDVRILLRILLQGGRVARLNHFIYYTTPSGKGNSGGVDYENQLKERELKRLISEYPNIVEKQEGLTRYGQPKYTIHWKRVPITSRKVSMQGITK